MPTATVQVRQTTTTTTARASVLVINTGYCWSRLGLIKLLLLILSLICFIFLLLEASYNWGDRRYLYYHYAYPSADQFLILVCFANGYAIAIMLLAALLSLGTASLLPKTSFDFIFHIIGCILYLIGGLWVAVGAFSNYERSFKVKTASIMAIICGILHLVHGVLSYRLCITN